MTAKQKEILNDMFDRLDNEFDFGTVGKKEDYTGREAFELIRINSELFYGIVDGGQCTVRQYNRLTEIAGRKPKLERHLIGYTQAIDWIKQYGTV